MATEESPFTEYLDEVKAKRQRNKKAMFKALNESGKPIPDPPPVSQIMAHHFNRVTLPEINPNKGK